MTTAAAESHSETGRARPTSGTRRMRVDLIGLGAVLLAGLGLAGTVIVARAPAPEAWRTPSVSAAVTSAPPVRDRWYLEDSSQAPRAPDLTGAGVTVAASRGSPVARDQWYAEGAVATASPVWDQSRDRWYLHPGAASDVPKDRWYSDRQHLNR
jgi:hypothetical protein